VDDDDARPKRPGLAGGLVNQMGRNVGQLDPRDCQDTHLAGGDVAFADENLEDALLVVEARVVGHGDGLVAVHDGAADELDGRKLAVAEERVGVEVVDVADNLEHGRMIPHASCPRARPLTRF